MENNTSINNNIIKKEEISKYLKGTSIALKSLLNKRFKIYGYCKVESSKPDSDYFYAFQILTAIKKDGKTIPLCYVTHTGAKEIIAFFDKVSQGIITLSEPVKLCADNKMLYFEGYRSYNEDIARDIIAKSGISLDGIDVLDEELV